MRAGIGETESAPSCMDARPPSRFSSGSGTKADAKQQPWAFASVRVNAHGFKAARSGFAWLTRFLGVWGKEFRFAYF